MLLTMPGPVLLLICNDYACAALQHIYAYLQVYSCWHLRWTCKKIIFKGTAMKEVWIIFFQGFDSLLGNWNALFERRPSSNTYTGKGNLIPAPYFYAHQLQHFLILYLLFELENWSISFKSKACPKLPPSLKVSFIKLGGPTEKIERRSRYVTVKGNVDSCHWSSPSWSFTWRLNWKDSKAHRCPLVLRYLIDTTWSDVLWLFLHIVGEDFGLLIKSL